MRTTLAVLCLVAMACGGEPSDGAMQPMGVAGDGVSETVRPALDVLMEHVPEPSPCQVTAALGLAWSCMGRSDWEHVSLLQIDFVWEACPAAIGDIEHAANDCDQLGLFLDDATMACATGAQDSLAFVCCYLGSDVFGDEIGERIAEGKCAPVAP
jgi:hypothetical protein